MNSLHHTLMREAASTIHEVNGERDSNGAPTTIKMHRIAGTTLNLTGVSFGAVVMAEQVKPNGDVVNRLTRTISFMQQHELTSIEQRAWFDIDGEGWVPQENGSTFTGVHFIYALERSPLQQMDPKRDAHSV